MTTEPPPTAPSSEVADSSTRPLPGDRGVDTGTPDEAIREQVLLHDSVAVAVYERGQDAPDRPTLVLAHGWPDSAEVWDLVADRLAERFHVVTYDMRGMGASSRALTPSPYRIDRLATEMRAVIDATSAGRPVHLIGHDWGSVIGWEFAMTPDLAGRLASFTSLSGPNLDHTATVMRSSGGRSGSKGRGASLSQALKSSYTLVLSIPVVSTLPWRLGAGRLFKAWLRVTEGIRDYPGSGLAHDAVAGVPLYRANIAYRMRRPNLRPVSTPVHLIVATKDRYVSPKMVAMLSDWLPGLTTSRVGAGHWSPRSHPDEIADLIANYVDGLRPSDGGDASAVGPGDGARTTSVPDLMKTAAEVHRP